MMVDICGDPNCPNARRVAELEAEIAKLRKELKDYYDRAISAENAVVSQMKQSDFVR